jgi:magnesium transporter
VIVDSAIYERGRRVEVDGVEGVADRLRRSGDGFVWVGLVEPTAGEFESVAREFGLHELAVEDAVEAHQRPKLELYDGTLFLVLKTVLYRDPDEMVEIGEVMLFVGANFLISVRHGEGGGLGDVREHLEQRPDLLRQGPSAAMHAIVDRVVDAYQPAVASIRDDAEEVEAQVFSDDRVNPVERIYRLHREVIAFSRAASLLAPVVDELASPDLPGVAPEMRHYLRDVADHAMRVVEQLEALRQLLNGILQAHLAQVGVRQNEDVRRISAWAAIAVVPTGVASIYGMNFDHMPELHWRIGYPLMLTLTAAACVYLYRRFRRSGWL